MLKLGYVSVLNAGAQGSSYREIAKQFHASNPYQMRKSVKKSGSDEELQKRSKKANCVRRVTNNLDIRELFCDHLDDLSISMRT